MVTRHALNSLGLLLLFLSSSSARTEPLSPELTVSGLPSLQRAGLKLHEDPADLRSEARAILEHLHVHGTLPPPSWRQTASVSSVPKVIRVWRRSLGGNASCSGRVDVVPLEDYVKRVLPHEWIASWSSHSLRAGAVAVRSYAVYWANKGGKYTCADLCDTIYSQKYEESTSSKTDQAVDDTTGQVLTKAGEVFMTEYCAEHGPWYSYDDPITQERHTIDDWVCNGSANQNSHGRGMCQWGSQRWAKHGKSYTEILSHYYPGTSLFSGYLPPEQPPWEQPAPSSDTGFIGDSCSHGSECSGGTCATEYQHNFPGGMCTQSCGDGDPGMYGDPRLCPDSAGRAITFCARVRTPNGNRGYCFSRCGYSGAPSCRAGYRCTPFGVPRYRQEEVTKRICVPEWALGKADGSDLSVDSPLSDASEPAHGCAVSHESPSAPPVHLLLLLLPVLAMRRRRRG